MESILKDAFIIYLEKNNDNNNNNDNDKMMMMTMPLGNIST